METVGPVAAHQNKYINMKTLSENKKNQVNGVCFRVIFRMLKTLVQSSRPVDVA